MRRLGLFALLLCGMAQIGLLAQSMPYSLKFDENKYTMQTFTFEGKEYKVRAFENIIYVANPVDTVYQKMNIYIPEDFYHDKLINGFTRETAAIFFPNAVGGYMPAQPMTLNGGRGNVFGQRGRGPGDDASPNRPPRMPQQPPGADMKQGSAIHYALAHGYIVASAGARGRSLQNSEGVYTGKAPAWENINELK